ncbi:protease complex subunit PrcB family protein [Flavobacterium sp. NST-5]|uniref:Protease complex subunit PrcB family protein n=1 Tax=Flavobacterium ichthyis TaxID=2698827 RepID=A0ABW9Z7M4_9FLAO|nr:protease complex subunit PrcB family protein [Flavobacterium ichthyis]NBL64196.1 protease complex subunit PrcB family protein [Flavobacterium ichthyis]
MKNIITAITAVALLSCNSSQKKSSEAFQKSSKELVTVLAKSEYGGLEQKSFEVINNSTDFTELLQKINLDGNLEVDFKKEQVVALFLGQKNTGGHSINIKSVEEKNEILLITVEKILPKDGEIVTMALTNPYVIAKISSTKAIKFVE